MTDNLVDSNSQNKKFTNPNKLGNNTNNGNNTHKSKNKPNPTIGQCEGCGKRHANGIEDCHFKKHPDFNTSGKPWPNSPIGEFYKTNGRDSLQSNLKKNNNELVERNQEIRQQDKSTYKKKSLYKHKHNKQSKLTNNVITTRQLCNICTVTKQTNTNKKALHTYTCFF